MRYRVKTLGPGATVVRTDVDATDENAARAALGARGITVLSLRPAGFAPGARGGGRFPLLLFNQELVALLNAGIPLAEALAALADKEPRGAVREVLAGVREALREGRSLSAAMDSHPAAFPELYRALIRAAERTSDLDRALTRYIAYQQQVDALRGKLASAAVYPVMLLLTGGAVVLFLLGYVVPRFSHIYQDVGGDLPLLSRMLMEWGRFVEGNAALLGAVALAIGAALAWLVRRPRLWAAAGRALWRAPVIGERLRIFQLARLYRTLGMLLRGGIPAVHAMRMVTGLLDPSLRGSLERTIERVREGAGLSATLAANGLTTPVSVRMVEVGERAGNLGEMLENAAAFHEEQTAREVEWLTRLFGPLLMLVIGSAIGFVVMLMYMPIFQLAESIQ